MLAGFNMYPPPKGLGTPRSAHCGSLGYASHYNTCFLTEGAFKQWRVDVSSISFLSERCQRESLKTDFTGWHRPSVTMDTHLFHSVTSSACIHPMPRILELKESEVIPAVRFKKWKKNNPSHEKASTVPKLTVLFEASRHTLKSFSLFHCFDTVAAFGSLR